MPIKKKPIFEEYEKLGDPDKMEKVGIWKAAIGLQKVDGLKVSPYLLKLAKQNIEGEISIHEVQERLSAYYERKRGGSKAQNEQEIDS